MPGQVEQDVDPVRSDLFDELPVVHRPHASPIARRRPQAIGHRVALETVGITRHLRLLAIQVFQQSNQEITHRMKSQVRRDEANAQPMIGLASHCRIGQEATKRRAGRQSLNAPRPIGPK